MVINNSRVRAALLASTALLAVPGVAHAEAAAPGAPTNAYREAQSKATVADIGTATNVYLEAQGKYSIADAGDATDTYMEAQRIGVNKVAAPTPEILIANPNTTTTARDPVNINGIGQMIVDSQDGFIGLCTATLINPRVVIFAAHCVNSVSAATYGANSGGRPIGFGFETNTRANAAGQPDELLNWYNGGSTGPGKNKSNIAQAFYNSNWVAYNPLSLEPDAQEFLYGDVALAALDTPAANVPTWALLFSQLTNTGTIGAAGTGFNVGLAGYGAIGTGQTGQTANSDFRRRAADNIIGALTDLETFESFLFGGPPNGLKQNLYFVDFDDPRRGMNTASPFDFNAFRDNARGAGTTNPTEGITAPGDSGGPLILQNAFAKQVVIGVLSGGYARFFNGQPQYGYGAVSFYQPLYLYWDWIAANNPYHYVASKAGDASWTDATHWVSTLDPAYMIQSGNQLINGIPTLTGQQKDGTSGDFGQICFQSGGSSDCYDTRTGTETIEARPIGTAANQPATGTATDNSATADATGAVNRGDLLPDLKPEAQAVATALPPATIANGLPGATNFVPNNADPVRTGAAISAPRYFDVTLAATGTTTLSGASVTIDRLTIGTSGAQLVIASGASLTSLINVNQFAGFNTVNGTLTSVGDYSLFGGGLLGTGRINAPFLNSVLGQIAPGTTTTIGTLTVGGNLMLSSGSTYFVNLGGANTSDVLAVVANGTATGTANVGGTVSLTPIAGATIRNGDLYTILTATGGVTGAFAPSSAFSAILTPQFVYSTNAVQVRVNAGLYANVVANTPVQRAYASLLDNNRAANQSRLGGLYDFLDLQNAATISATLEGLAPRTETLVRSLGTAAVDNMDRMYRARVESMNLGGFDGSLAIVGSPLQVLTTATSAGAITAGAGAALTSMQPDAQVEPGRLPNGTRGFIAGGYLDGKGRSMPTAIPFGGKDKFDGWYVAAGIEAMAGENSAVGFGLSYSDLDGDTRGAPQSVKGRFYQGTLYGKTQTNSGIVLDGRLSAGQLSISTRRAAVVGPNTYDLRSKDNTLAVSSEVGLAKLFGTDALKFGPRVAFRSSNIGFSKTIETGGPAALFLDRKEKGSAQGLAGLTLSSDSVSFKPFASAYYVHDFLDQPASFGANFVGGAGPNSLFALARQDRNWGEAALGLTIGGEKINFSISADTTLFRKDVENQAYRGSVSIAF